MFVSSWSHCKRRICKDNAVQIPIQIIRDRQFLFKSLLYLNFYLIQKRDKNI